LDGPGNIGDPIYAPFDGVVESVSNWGDFGYQIWVMSVVNGQTIRYLLAHCSAIYPSIGDIVESGALIARIGDTGNAEGTSFPHVHVGIEEKIGGNWSDFVNPLNYLTTQYDLNWTTSPCNR